MMHNRMTEWRGHYFRKIGQGNPLGRGDIEERPVISIRLKCFSPLNVKAEMDLVFPSPFYR